MLQNLSNNPYEKLTMKLLVVFTGLLAACATTPISPVPTVPGDNSHYIEGESRYVWITDGDDVPRLVDLEEPVDEQILNTRNGADNQYWLYTRRNPTNAQIIRNGDVNSIRNSNYNPNAPLNVLVHGWNGNGNAGVNTNGRDAFLAVSDCNVIVVDWRGLAGANYVSAVSGVPNIGQHLGNFLQWLISNGGGNWNNVHLAGFSLGAHVVGNAGRQSGSRVSRVTGLDPAGPLWAGNNNALRNNDGQYVEAIHTDGGIQGIMNTIGRSNFYPNGGRNQAGCSSSACNHSRSYQFFAATIRYNHLVGRRCTNIQQAENNQCTGATLNMGNAILSKRGEGIYGLRTGANWPF